jgi:hypothetical protein
MRNRSLIDLMGLNHQSGAGLYKEIDRSLRKMLHCAFAIYIWKISKMTVEEPIGDLTPIRRRD